MQYKFVAAVGIVAFAVLGCGDGDPGSSEGEVGSLRAAIDISGGRHDVTAVRFAVMAAGEACDAEPIFSEIVGLEDEVLPASLAESGNHAFGDRLFVLPPGSYRVCAQPLSGEGASAECGAAEALAEVSAGVTTEVVIDSQCEVTGNGGLGAVVALNDEPVIDEISLDPSGFISTCESALIVASASDANDDELSYAWSVVAGPGGASLRADGAAATFSGPAGDYSLELSVDDGHGGVTSLAFPMHVSSAVCEVPAEVQAIFTARCSPCHTTGSSGGLHLDPATASYANLVGVPSSSAACASRTRVIPGDSTASYLMAKLRGDAGICGVRMPRNLPPLPDEEIATIAAWIDGLPH